MTTTCFQMIILETGIDNIMKIKIGITGEGGFLGTHLYNSLGLFNEEFERIKFDRSFFDDQKLLNDFVSNCDVVIHLAAMNRHADNEVLYDTNVSLVNRLIEALTQSKTKTKVLFSSSTQEESQNIYGNSKRVGRELLSEWAKKTGNKFTGMIIPNVFGPFGNPYYNSFIATFCEVLIKGEVPKIEHDGFVKLIYVNDLVQRILKEVKSDESFDRLIIEHTDEYFVSEVLTYLEAYKNLYLDSGIIPELKSSFEINLFNTFRSYINQKQYFPKAYTQHTDARGSFVEIIRLNIGGQISFSTTLPEVTRGNHYHTRKIERFSVIKGKALIQLRRIGTEEVLDFYLDGDEPAYVDMPIWYTHNIKNIGNEILYTNFWINEFYNHEDPDTYFEEV